MFFKPRRRGQRGQMIVIVAFGLTALIAMAGLVIDGGMAWANRRQVQNAADAASLAGTRVLGLDLKWRSVNASNPSPPPAPFPDVDAAVCDAINNALSYNTNSGQLIPAIDCYTGSDEAWYVDFARNEINRVGEGVPSVAQGVKVVGTGQSSTLLMGIIGISTVDVSADAVALAGPGEPPLGSLMPFVAQNPLGPFVPGEQYQLRSEDEGECETSAAPSHLADAMDAGIVLASYVDPPEQDVLLAAAPPSVPIASPTPNPPSTPLTSPVTVTLTAESGAKIYYTTDGSTPTTASAQYSSALTFASDTTLKAIARKGNLNSEVGTFTYTFGTPPDAVTADPPDGTVIDGETTVTLSTETAGATIYYTTDGSDPVVGGGSTTAGSSVVISDSTQIRAMAVEGLLTSGVAIFNYTLAGSTEAPVADPPSGEEFESTLNVTLSSSTSGAEIYYTTDGSTPTTSSTLYDGPISLVSTTTIRAFATLDGSDSLVSQFTYTKVGPVCPELTSGNFGWLDFSGGSNSNAQLKNEIENPSLAATDWYYRDCTGSGDTNCRDPHDPADAADDHWLVEGTPGHRDSSLREVCQHWLNEIIYVPIWDDMHLLPSKKPNGNNAVFHIIGFAAFKLDGVIDNHQNTGDPTNQACGEGLNLGGTPNDKGFVGTYVDSFVGTQVAPCIPSADGTNPCQNLQNDRLEINLAS